MSEIREIDGQDGTPGEPGAPPARRLGVMARLRNYFLTGLVVAAPIGLTVYIVSWFVDLIDTWFVPLIPAQLQPEHYLPFDIPGLGLIIALVLLTALGALTANFFGQAILRFAERVVERMPIVRGIYSALKQIFETVLSQSAPSFRQVVLIEYPRKGIYSLGFITAPMRSDVADVGVGDLVGVFVPTTPNPTSGFLLYLPRDEVKVLDIAVEDGLKLIVSLGIVEVKRK